MDLVKITKDVEIENSSVKTVKKLRQSLNGMGHGNLSIKVLQKSKMQKFNL